MSSWDQRTWRKVRVALRSSLTDKRKPGFCQRKVRKSRGGEEEKRFLLLGLVAEWKEEAAPGLSCAALISL